MRRWRRVPASSSWSLVEFGTNHADIFVEYSSSVEKRWRTAILVAGIGSRRIQPFIECRTTERLCTHV